MRYRSACGSSATRLAGDFTPIDGFDRGMAPRRVALDPVLAEAALEAGAEGRFGEKVSELFEQDGAGCGA